MRWHDFESQSSFFFSNKKYKRNEMSVKCHVLLASSHFYSFLPHSPLTINYCYVLNISWDSIRLYFHPTIYSSLYVHVHACRASSKLLLLSWTMEFNLILQFFFFFVIIPNGNGNVHCRCKIKQENVPCELSTHAVVHATAVVSSSAELLHRQLKYHLKRATR